MWLQFGYCRKAPSSQIFPNLRGGEEAGNSKFFNITVCFVVDEARVGMMIEWHPKTLS